MSNVVAIRRKARVLFTDGSAMNLVNVNVTKAKLHKHYNAFCRRCGLRARVKKVEFT